MSEQNSSSNPAEMGDTTVYTWESELVHPRRFFRSACVDLVRAVELSYRIFRRDLSSQYRETLFGLIWLWVPALTVSATFILAESANLITIDNTGIPYPAYILISTILWQVFAETAAAPLKAIDAAKTLMSRVRFPVEAMILARLWDIGLSFLVKLPLLVGVLLWYRIPLTWEIALFPVGLLSLFSMGLFVGLILVPIGGLYQDVNKSLPLILTFWMFLTPVVFASQVGGLMGTIVKLNPITPLLVLTRSFVAGLPVTDYTAFTVLTLVAFAAVLVSWLLVRISIPILVERAGN